MYDDMILGRASLLVLLETELILRAIPCTIFLYLCFCSLNQEPEAPGSIPRSGRMLSFLFPLIQEGQLSVLLAKVLHKELFNRLGGLILPSRKVCLA